jgi:hypothetical protein
VTANTAWRRGEDRDSLPMNTDPAIIEALTNALAALVAVDQIVDVAIANMCSVLGIPNPDDGG